MAMVSWTLGSPISTGWTAPLQGRILLDVLAVFIERGGADQRNSSPRASAGLRRLPASIAPSAAPAPRLCEARHEQDHLPVALLHFLDDSLEAVLKLPAELRPGDQGADVQGDDAFVLKADRDIAFHHADGEALGDGGLADARFADQHGVVLRPAVKHLHRPTDLFIAAR